MSRLDLLELYWQKHPAISKTTATPPSHHVAVTLDIKQDIMSRIDPTAYQMMESVFIAFVLIM